MKMIRATMYWERLRLEVEGHGEGEFGKDLVCCGASMLVQALDGTLAEAEMRGRCECKTRNDPGESGKAIIWANPTMGSLNEIKAYFRMTVKGFRMLMEQYPGKVIVREL
jgi:uncharacterized protein YsxB (DUF464 family)